MDDDCRQCQLIGSLHSTKQRHQRDGHSHQRQYQRHRYCHRQAQTSIQNSALANLVTTLYADGSLNRADVMQVLRSVGTDGTVDATELGDLRYIVANAVTYAMPGYVQVLASNVVNSNAATLGIKALRQAI